MKLDLDTSAGDEVAEIIHSLALLRKRCRHAGPMITSRIWKAEMQLRNLASEIAAGGTPVAGAMKLSRGAVRPNKRCLKRVCAGTPTQLHTRNGKYPLEARMTPRAQ